MTVAFDPSSMKAEDTRTLSTSFTDYVGVKGALSDQTANIQDFLFYAQKLFFEAKGGSTGLDDQMLSARGIDAIIPNRLYITNPIIIPQHVRLVLPDGIALGTLTGGALLSSYNGDPATSKVLANVCFPMLMVPHGASTDDIVLYCTNGTQAVSGYAHGKNWVPNVFPPVFVRAPVVTAAVTTSATTIGYSEFDGQLFSVSGVTGSTRFTDLILVSPGRNPVVVVNDTGTGSPATRTYTLDTVTDKGAIKLAMGSGSYAVTLTEKRA